MIIEEVNKTMKGWYEYFKHSHKGVLNTVDQWIRMRLRSIKREKRWKKRKRI